MAGKTAYKTGVVKTELLERTLDVMFELMEQRGCDIRDISQSDIYKKGKINRKTFYNNFRGVGGIHKAIAEDVKRHLSRSLGIKAGSGAQLNMIILMRMLTELKSKSREVDFSILSADQEFWIVSVSALEPLLQSAWACRSEKAYDICLQMFAAVFSKVAVEWSKKHYDSNFQSSAAALLSEYAKQIGQIDRDLQFFLDSIELLK